MIREDVKYIMNSDWEPRVPTTDVIRRQVSSVPNLAGNIRMSLGKVISSDYETYQEKIKKIKRA